MIYFILGCLTLAIGTYMTEGLSNAYKKGFRDGYDAGCEDSWYSYMEDKH